MINKSFRAWHILRIYTQYTRSYHHSLFKRIDRQLYMCKSEFQSRMHYTVEMKGNRRVEDI